VAAPGLDLDQADAGWRDQDEGDLVDRTVAGDKLAVRPGAKGSPLGRMVCSQVSAARSQANSVGVH
jgi:hypothetical protein